MPTIRTDDGVNLYYEEAGSGTPVIFVHEFAGDWRSWEPQMRHFSRRYRCVTYSMRGYLPSDVPEGAHRYLQDRMRDDILAVMDGLKIDRDIVACLLSMINHNYSGLTADFQRHSPNIIISVFRIHSDKLRL